MTDRIRGWLRARTQRDLAYAGAATAILVAVLYETVVGTPGPMFLWTPAPVALVAGWLLRREARWILGTAALSVAAANGNDGVYLGWAVGALVFLALVDDPSERPWVGWAAGLAGSVLCVWLFRDLTLAPFVATGIGVLCASALRSRARTSALAEETRSLRGQATWLEQRTVLARELHDVVGHHVTAMVVQAEAGQVTDPQAALGVIADTGRTALAELDALVVHLRDPSSTAVLTAPPQLSDIDELLAQPLRAQGVQVHVRVAPESGLDEVGVLTAYRIVQEALTNIARHAGADTAWVEIRRSDGHVRIRVSDDEAGPPAGLQRGSGLLGVQERAHLLGGTLDLGTRPGVARCSTSPCLQPDDPRRRRRRPAARPRGVRPDPVLRTRDRGGTRG